MKLTTYALISQFIVAAYGNKVTFDEGSNSQVCAGVYSKHDWGGSDKPMIEVNLAQFGSEVYDPKSKSYDEGREDTVSVTYVLFEYKDIGNIGVYLDGGYRYICDDIAIEGGACEEKQRNRFIIANVTNSTIVSGQLSHVGSAHIEYAVNQTGYYCFSTFTTVADKKYKGEVNFHNAFGELSGSEIPKLPAYGILSICYAIALSLFSFQFFKKRKENQILPLQRYLLAILGFLTFDTIVVWSYYDLVNRTKSPNNAFVLVYMSFLSLLNAAKITFSFFLLLCIGLGYGVVSLKLKKSLMFKCKLLAAAHFIASLVYLIPTYYNGEAFTTSSSSNIDEKYGGSIWGLITMIPITITLTIYYITILGSIRQTTANLHKQRQVIKLQLYQKLFKIILFSVVLTMAGLVISSFIFLSMSNTDMIESHWKSAFFIFDFWPSAIFFFVFIGVAWLWRPTETSYMLAISQQLSGEGQELDDDAAAEQQHAGYHQGREFELDDLSLLSHSDDEAENNRREDGDQDSFELRNTHPAVNDNATSSSAVLEPPVYDAYDKKVTQEEDIPENSTLFEVGDHDEESDEERADDRLTSK